MFSDACPGTCTEHQHRFVHRTRLLLALKPPFRSELVRIFAKNSLVELDYHGIHPNLVLVSGKSSMIMLNAEPWSQAEGSILRFPGQRQGHSAALVPRKVERSVATLG